MKKVLSTALVAVIVATAAVSTIDARQTTSRRSRMGSQTRTETVAPKTLVQTANQLKDAAPEEKQLIADDLIAALLSDESLQELVRLRVKQKLIVAKMMEAKENMAMGKRGWLWGGDETYTKANAEYTRLKGELSAVNKEIAALETEEPKETTSSIRYAVGALALALGATALDYYISGGEYTVKPVRRAGSWTAGQAAAAGRGVRAAYKTYAPARLGGTSTADSQ